MSVRELRHNRPSRRFSKSRGLSASVSFLSSPPSPPFYLRHFTLLAAISWLLVYNLNNGDKGYKCWFTCFVAKKVKVVFWKYQGKALKNFYCFCCLHLVHAAWRGTWGFAVLGFFSCGISVILILTCGIAVSSSSAVCGFSSFWLTVFGEIRLFTVLRYRLFALSFRYNTQNKTQ